MTKHFHFEIERLKKKILYLAALVEKSLHNAVKSIMENNPGLAEEVINSDPDIDALEVEVEEECLKILALHQPVANDLRYIIAVMKINNDLERIADLAVNIAERTMIVTQYAGIPIRFDLTTMLEITVGMVKESVDALVDSDADKAREVIQNDDSIDELNEEAHRVFQEQICNHPDLSKYYISLLSVSKNLERIADHATNIAEDVIYMIVGEIVRHQGKSD